MNIFELFGTIAIENKDANEAIDETSQKANSFTQTIRKSIGTAAKWGAGIATAVTAAATVAARKINELANNAAAEADQIDKMSQMMGLSTTGYQEWRYAMQKSGLEIEVMEEGIASMLDKMTAVNEGSKDAIKVFEALGISCFDTNGNMKGTERMMEEIIYTLADMEEGTERTQLAMEIFGGAGEKLAPLLNNGEKGIRGMMESAHELGLIMSDENVKAGVKFTDTMTDVNATLSTIKNEVGFSVMEPLQKFYDFIIENTPAIKEKISEWAEPISGVVDAFVDGFIWIFGDSEENMFNKGMARIDATFEETVSSIKNKFAEVDLLLGTIETLSQKTQLTTEETALWQAATTRLCELIPEFNEVFNSETTAITGGTTALRDRAAALKEVALAEAKEKALQGKRDAVAEAYATLANAQLEYDVQSALLPDKKEAYENALKAYDDWYAENGTGWITGEKRDTMNQLLDDIKRTQDDYTDSKERLEEAQKTLTELPDDVKRVEAELEAAEKIVDIGLGLVEAQTAETTPKTADQVTGADVAGLESKLAQIITLLAQAVTNMGRDTALYLNGAVIAGALSKNINGLWSKETIRSERGN